jgi:y4mF family transcriptional regulator
MNISDFIKEKRKQLNLTQPELAERAGVGLRFIRELEQGKQSVRLDKVNQVLALFGSEIGVHTITNCELTITNEKG